MSLTICLSLRLYCLIVKFIQQTIHLPNIFSLLLHIRQRLVMNPQLENVWHVYTLIALIVSLVVHIHDHPCACVCRAWNKIKTGTQSLKITTRSTLKGNFDSKHNAEPFSAFGKCKKLQTVQYVVLLLKFLKFCFHVESIGKAPSTYFINIQFSHLYKVCLLL